MGTQKTAFGKIGKSKEKPFTAPAKGKMERKAKEPEKNSFKKSKPDCY
jgi:hypothetical protein